MCFAYYRWTKMTKYMGIDDHDQLGSGLIDYSQKITDAAMQMAEKKVCAQRS